MQRELLTELMMYAPGQPATNYWRAVETQEVIRYGLPPGRGLDLGCGDGHLMGIILSHTGPRDVVGIDIDPRETAVAARRNVYSEIATAPADHMLFPDGHFEFVFSNSVLEHIENIHETLGEVARVLRLAGRFLFTVPGPGFHQCLRGTSFGSRDAYLRALDARCAHLRYWTPAQWEESLERAGLTMVHHHEYLTKPQVQRWERMSRYTGGLLYHLVRKKQQPIEIQRQLGIRSTHFHLPKPLASAIAALISIEGSDQAGPHGCLLIEARKE